MPPQRRLLTRSSRPTEGPITRAFTRNQRTADPLPLVLNVSTTPVAIREVSTEPSTPTSPTLDTHGYRRALRRQRSAAFVQAVLHYDRSENDLQPWFWPVNEAGERVAPSDLLEYRQSHEFLGPSCLCASLRPDTASYTEAAIFLAKSGPSTGKYVAACATDRCRYWVCLEQLYDQIGLLVRRYPLRDDKVNIAMPPDTPQSQSFAARQLLEVERRIGSTIDLVVQSATSSGSRSNKPFAPASTARISDFTPESLSECPFSLLLQLDDISQPGIPEDVFHELFSRCRRCRQYMTRRATMFHKCKQDRHDAEVIDLTNEN